MNRSEIFLIVTAGMATVAGACWPPTWASSAATTRCSAFFAKHLLTASVMAAPGAVVVARCCTPDRTGGPAHGHQHGTGGKQLPGRHGQRHHRGLKLAANVGAMLLVFFAFIAMFNYAFFKLGDVMGLNGWVAEVSGELPVLLPRVPAGLPLRPADVADRGGERGHHPHRPVDREKIVASEFVGYESLSSLKAAGAFAHQRSIVIHALRLRQLRQHRHPDRRHRLLAPGKRQWLSEFGFRALVGGTLASLLSATIVGMLV